MAVGDLKQVKIGGSPGEQRILLEEQADGSYLLMSTVREAGSTVLIAGAKTVTTAGTAEPLVATATPCRRVIIQSHPGNTAGIMIGDAASQPFQLAPNERIELFVRDLSMIWVDSVQSSETVDYLAVE